MREDPQCVATNTLFNLNDLNNLNSFYKLISFPLAALQQYAVDKKSQHVLRNFVDNPAHNSLTCRQGPHRVAG
jgi:hypothetical protein